MDPRAPAGGCRLLGGIIAAGEGSRLRRDGFTAHKPLVEVGGVPLIERVLENFEAAGIAPPIVIVNEDERECVERVRARFPARAVEFIVKTTASSLESFRLVTGATRRGPMLVSTVDAWCRPSDFAAFVDAAMRRPTDATVLAVTPFVADEKPLWVDLDAGGRVAALGRSRGAFVTAGMYLVPESVRRAAPPAGLGRLRDFLGWLHQSGHAMYGEVIPAVVDVDRAEDVAIAEALERTAEANRAGGRER
jgi:NDP-sugar pyrophosphorylase family protein